MPRTCDACAGWLVVRSDLSSHLLIHVVVGMFYALNLSKSLKVSVRKPFTTTTICNQPNTCKAYSESAHSFLRSKCFIENGVTFEKVVTRPALRNLGLVGLRQGGGVPPVGVNHLLPVTSGRGMEGTPVLGVFLLALA